MIDESVLDLCSLRISPRFFASEAEGFGIGIFIGCWFI
jgi:hypothetical protein